MTSDWLDKLCAVAEQKVLLNRLVTYKPPVGAIQHKVFRGLTRDECGDACAVLADDYHDIECSLVHPSRVLELTQED